MNAFILYGKIKSDKLWESSVILGLKHPCTTSFTGELILTFCQLFNKSIPVMVLDCLPEHQRVGGFDAGRILYCEEQRVAQPGALRGVSLVCSRLHNLPFPGVFNVTAHCPVACLPQRLHRPAAGWGAEAAGLPITVSPNRATNPIP